MKTNVTEIFASKVFNEEQMQQRLAKDTFKELQKTIRDGKPLNIKIANAVAHAMKEWALENGATHFTHWFQPMTGVTAEKHDFLMEVYVPLLKLEGILRGIQHHMLLSKTMYYAFQQPSVLIQVMP